MNFLTFGGVCAGCQSVYFILQEVTGGLFLRPIPGHMLQTVEKTPQV